MKKINHFIPLIAFFVVLTIPSFVFAGPPTNLIVCDPATGPDCTFQDLVKLGVNLINFLVILSTALAALSFCWAGFLYLSSGGDEGQAKKAKSIFTKTGIGFIFVLSAWLIVNAVMSSLVSSSFNLPSI